MSQRAGEHAQLRLTADLVILTIRDDALSVLLVERGNDPFKGERALPGGFVSNNESVDQAALRELRESAPADLEWTVLSPPPVIDQGGSRTGVYRYGADDMTRVADAVLDVAA